MRSLSCVPFCFLPSSAIRPPPRPRCTAQPNPARLNTHSPPEKAHLNLQAKTAQVDELNESGGVCWYYVVIVILIVLLVFLIGTHGGKDILR